MSSDTDDRPDAETEDIDRLLRQAGNERVREQLKATGNAPIRMGRGPEVALSGEQKSIFRKYGGSLDRHAEMVKKVAEAADGATPEQLDALWVRLLDEPELRELLFTDGNEPIEIGDESVRLSPRQRQIIREYQGSIERYVDMLEELVKGAKVPTILVTLA